MASLAVGVLPSLRRGDGTWRQRSGEARNEGGGGADGGAGAGDDDVEMQRSHGREASGRSVLSSMSERLAALRASDSASTRNAAARDVEAQMMRADRNAAAAEAANTPAAAGAPPATFRSAAYLGGLRGLSGAAQRKGPSRREREEAATLFGPNLANYFGSGSSSSGAVLGSTPTPAAAAAAATAATAAADATIAGRRARLGSRGRARGASLSGVASQLSLNQADDSMTSLPLDAGSPVIAHPLDGAATGALPQGDVVAMAEGIELDTLKRWIQRSVDGGATEVPQKGAAQDAAAPGSSLSGAPPAICSTLQSYVNLKRNTVKLSVEQGVAATAVAAGAAPAVAQDEAAQGATLHNALSSGNLSIAPGMSGGNAGLGSMPSVSGPKPTSTHLLHFEYDCAAPSASLQLFLRASRKHGSWLNASLVDGSSDEASSSAAVAGHKFMAQRGPPPHVLGWPVHSAKLHRGFGEPLRTALALKLEYYAPPAGYKKKTKGAAGEEEDEDDEEVLDLPAETPGVNISRQLGETPGLNDSRQLGDRPAPAATPAPEANAQVPAAPTSAEPETKEAKAAREKLERETLKLAIVVEALDEDGKPLREPNLQTTYLRLTSLPARTSPNAPVDAELAQAALEGTAAPDVASAAEPGAPLRMWSVQVEGQEAEIGPHRFQLQELYGLSTRPPPVRAAPADGEADETAGATAPPLLDLEGSNGTECLICLSAPPTTLLLPCTHSLCLECAVQLRESVKAMRETERRRGRTPRRKYCCPACRRAFTSMLHLSAADEKQMAQATM